MPNTYLSYIQEWKLEEGNAHVISRVHEFVLGRGISKLNSKCLM